MIWITAWIVTNLWGLWSGLTLSSLVPSKFIMFALYHPFFLHTFFLFPPKKHRSLLFISGIDLHLFFWIRTIKRRLWLLLIISWLFHPFFALPFKHCFLLFIPAIYLHLLLDLGKLEKETVYEWKALSFHYAMEAQTGGGKNLYIFSCPPGQPTTSLSLITSEAIILFILSPLALPITLLNTTQTT